MRTLTTGLPDGFDAQALGQRVMDRCDSLAEHTDEPGRITRLFLSDATASVHAVLRRWMSEQGLAVRVDAAGNVIGHRSASPSLATTKTLVLGSHIDTVPGGGKYDGVLGVLIASAVIEALGSAVLPFHIDVVAFSEEEGVRFGLPYIGSRALAGSFDPAWLNRRDRDGVSLHGAIEHFGLDPDQIPKAALDPERFLGYTEVHLEQGPVLEHLKRPVGVVSGIQGQSRVRLRFEGDAAHAGTVPMDQRRDALVCAAKLAVEVQDYGRSVDELRATVGLFEVWPNVRNVVPGAVEMSLDVRHAQDEIRMAAVDALIETAERLSAADGVRFAVVEHQTQQATHVDGNLTAALVEALQASGVELTEMPSGAGHDAVAVADLGPVSMLFVRHPGGVSHHADERVWPDDVATAVEVMTRYVLGLADQCHEGTLRP